MKRLNILNNNKEVLIVKEIIAHIRELEEQAGVIPASLNELNNMNKDELENYIDAVYFMCIF
jgi:hypothetical protein